MALAFGLVFAPPSVRAAQTIHCVYVNDNLPEPGRQTVEQADDGLVTVTCLQKNNGAALS